MRYHCHKGEEPASPHASAGRIGVSRMKRIIITAIAVLAVLIGGFLLMQMPKEEPPGTSESLDEAMAMSLPTGDMPPEEPELEVQQLDEEETAVVEREIANQKPVRAASLFKNKAKTFYYRSKLSNDGRDVYDAIVKVCQTPKDTTRREVVRFGSSKDQNEASGVFWLARCAVSWDHPELFGFQMDSGGKVSAWLPHSANDLVDCIYVGVSKPYDNYEQEMGEFNEAVDKFMEDIDLTQPEANIALQIHDKICEWAFYDYEVWRGEYDLGHVAYGVLVRNGYGREHGAVCAGYAYAYQYLLQQAGIETAFANGNAGSTASTAEEHCWNLVKLGGDWYETDITWDDCLSDFEAKTRERAESSGKDWWYERLMEAGRDDSFVAALKHCMYNITTPEMTDFKSGDSCTYCYDDGWSFDFGGTSVHIRMCDVESSNKELSKELMKLAPEAEGTNWTWERSRNAKK